MRERDSGLQGIADHIAEVAVTLKTLLKLGWSAIALRMDEHQHAQLLGLGPEGMEFRVAYLRAGDVAADADPAQPELFDAFLELVGSEVGKLQCDGGERDEALRMLGTDFGEPLVLDLTIFCATSRSSPYQLGLMLSASMSMPCSSIAWRRTRILQPCRSGRRAGPPSFRFMRASASGTAQCA